MENPPSTEQDGLTAVVIDFHAQKGSVNIVLIVCDVRDIEANSTAIEVDDSPHESRSAEN